MELIKIKEVVGNSGNISVVSAREIQKESGGYPTDFSQWVLYRVKTLNLVEGKDYFTTVDAANARRKDYLVVLSKAVAVAEVGHYPFKEKVVSYLRSVIPESVAVSSVPARAQVFSAPAHLASVKTMSSVEIVEVINQLRPAGKAELRHDHFMEKVKGHPGINHPNFRGVYSDPKGEQRPCYYLPKREAELMVMSESLEVQTKVYDRLAELEQQVATFKLPQTYAEALLELAANVQRTEALQLENAQKAVQIEQQTMLIETQKPAVEFVEKYVEADGLKGFRNVAKLLGANEREFRNFLVDNKIQYRLEGKYMHYSQYGKDAQGYFDVKTCFNATTGNTYNQSYFTPKGVEWISRKWNNRKPVLTKKPSGIPNYTSYNT